MSLRKAAFAPMAVLFATTVFAQEKPVRRLESVTWNPADHKLSWTVSTGKAGADGKYEPKQTISYEIDMDAAVMTTNGEDRRFSKQEAVRVHALMDMVAKYAAESTVWWDAGEGEPLKGKDRSVIKRENREHRRQELPEVEQRQPNNRKLPGVKVIRIALNNEKSNELTQ